MFLRQTELAEKQVELLTQAFPERKRLAVLWDRISADQFEAAQRRAGLQHLEVISRKMDSPPMMSRLPSETSPTPRRTCS